MAHPDSPLTPAGRPAWSDVSKMMAAPSPMSLPKPVLSAWHYSHCERACVAMSADSVPARPGTTGRSSATGGSSPRIASDPTPSTPRTNGANLSASGSTMTTIIGRAPSAAISPCLTPTHRRRQRHDQLHLAKEIGCRWLESSEIRELGRPPTCHRRGSARTEPRSPRP